MVKLQLLFCKKVSLVLKKKLTRLGDHIFQVRKKVIFFCEELKKNLCFYETKVARTLIKKIYKPRMVNILSDETLGNACFKNQNLILRLKEIFPNARIFFTIRNQLDSIKSYYASQGRILKHAPMPFKGRFVKFKDWFDYEVENFLIILWV